MKQINIIKNWDQFINENYKRYKEVKDIVKILKSKKAFDILDNANDFDISFQFGGCWILADALSLYYELPIYVVYNKKKKNIEHFVVKINTMYIDSDGIQSDTTIMKKVAEDGKYDINDLEVIEYNKKMNSSDIIRDLDTSKKLVELFNK